MTVKVQVHLVNLHFHRLLVPAHSQSLSISHAHQLGGILICSAMRICFNTAVLLDYVDFNISNQGDIWMHAGSPDFLPGSMFVHLPPFLVPHDISKMAAPISILVFHHGMKCFPYTGFLVVKISWKRRIFISLAEAAFVCLLAQIQNWLECDCRFVGKQCTLLFSGSVAFNQCNAGGCWEKETVEREMAGEWVNDFPQRLFQ